MLDDADAGHDDDDDDGNDDTNENDDENDENGDKNENDDVETLQFFSFHLVQRWAGLEIHFDSRRVLKGHGQVTQIMMMMMMMTMRMMIIMMMMIIMIMIMMIIIHFDGHQVLKGRSVGHCNLNDNDDDGDFKDIWMMMMTVAR